MAKTPYHEIRGKAVAFGYMNEGTKTQLFMLPHENLTQPMISAHKERIRQEYCLDEDLFGVKRNYEITDSSGKKTDHHMITKGEAKRRAKKAGGKVTGEWDTYDGSKPSSVSEETNRDADRVQRMRKGWKPLSGKRNVNEEEESTLHHAISSFPLPPHKDESHEGYVTKHVEHFKNHLKAHGRGNVFSHKEARFLLAHAHLHQRGHITADLHTIAHHPEGSDEKEHVAHARHLLANATYPEDPIKKRASVMAHVVLKKIHPPPEAVEHKPNPPHPGFQHFEE